MTAWRTLRPYYAVLLMAGLLSPCWRLGTTQTPAATSQSPAADTGCCGPITPAGLKLMQFLDSLNVEHLWQPDVHVDWETGEPTPGFGKREPRTHCSAFAAAAAKRIGIYMLRPPEHKQEFLSEAQEKWFDSDAGRSDGWKPVSSSQEAQTLANQGEFVVLVYGTPGEAGHIAIVRPAVKSAKALAAEGPQTTQAGGHNFSSGTAKYSFMFHPGVWPSKVKIFAHATKFDATGSSVQ